ncbi:MAG: FMN-binding protein [Erysipelotrichales bacterium]|nr:MAG: FMN-binding protein [Erysipelotrichales bacterium]
MKKALYLALFLALTSALAGAVLSGVNSITAPIINDRAIAAVKTTLQEFFPQATEFAELEFEDATGLITNVYEAKGAGYAYNVKVQGYKDFITFVVAFSEEAKIVGFRVTAINDTPGIGVRVKDKEFSDGVIGKTSTSEIATLSGATISSSAVVKGIDAAKAHFNKMKGIKDDGSSVPVPNEPVITLGDPLLILSPATASSPATILDQTTEGNITTYRVSSKGYAALKGEEGGTEPNIYIIKIDTTLKTVVSVAYETFSDTKGFGDKTNSKTFLSQFEGLSLVDANASVDVVTSATYSSTSAARALRAVIGK